MRSMQQIAVIRGARKSFETPDPLAALLPAGNPRYLRCSWSLEELAQIGANERVLVLGAGSAAIDAVLALDEQGHRGTIRLVASRGLLPPAAPDVAERLAALQGLGRLEVCAGRVRGAAAYDDTFVVDILPRGRTLHASVRYDWIVNTTSAGDDQRYRASRGALNQCR
jgi:uncharacterized NAD(P)/FAD-binding protein YdhS